MPIGEKSQGNDGATEARLLLSDGEVIAGTISGRCGDSLPFHGWLELMDALEALRAAPACQDRQEV